MLKFYNSLTRKKETFKPIEKGKVKMYTCGPTVYNFVHIGNLRAYTFSDLLSRTLRHFKYDVNNVMNITDVDDKTIRDAGKEFSYERAEPNTILKKFTDRYTKYFNEDLDALNIIKPKTIISATASIKEMELLIDKLVEKGYAYVSEDGIYFDVKKYKEYGQLVDIDFSKQKYNKENRVVTDEYEKDNVQDFALWKFKKEKNEPSWKIKINKKEYEGRPGWHIECSAMSMKYLGETFDIHTGGIDLKFPHHENEIAQSECAHGIQFVNYWMHNEHLLVDNKKMSKSLGNFFTLRDLVEKGHNPLALREVYLRSHYRQQMNFTFDSLQAGETNVKKINEFYSYLQNVKAHKVGDDVEKIAKEKLTQFNSALEDDLNTPIAMSVLYEFMNEVNKIKELSQKDINYAIKFMQETDEVLGLLEVKSQLPKEVIELAKQRKIARDEKDFEKSDKLRDKLKDLGYVVRDSKDAKEGYIIDKL